MRRKGRQMTDRPEMVERFFLDNRYRITISDIKDSGAKFEIEEVLTEDPEGNPFDIAVYAEGDMDFGGCINIQFRPMHKNLRLHICEMADFVSLMTGLDMMCKELYPFENVGEKFNGA